MINCFICNYLENNAVMIRCQQGFVKKSCQTNLISFSQSVSFPEDCKNAVDIISFDFHKAFDKIPLDFSVNKLIEYGMDCLHPTGLVTNLSPHLILSQCVLGPL